MEKAVAKKMNGESEDEDEYGSKYPIEVEIKICATDYADLKRRLPLLFK